MTMLQFDFIEIDSRILRLTDIKFGVSAAFERIFWAWISGVAALTFLSALVLAIFGVISWSHLLYVYAGIIVITLALASLIYWSRREC